MPAIVTQDFKFSQVESFLNEIQLEGEKNYIFIGNPIEWVDESDPPAPIDNAENQQKIWDTIFAVKNVNAANIGKVIKRRNWSAGQVFDYYSPQMGEVAETNFYCLTSALNVYKCLWNNSGEPSSNEPSGTDLTEITYPDGYIWKYMYSIEAADALTFLTPEYMPVSIDAAVQDDRGQTAGSVMYVVPEVSGSNYLSTSSSGGGVIRPAVLRISSVDGSGSIISVEVIDGGLYSEGAGPTLTVTGGNGSGASISPSMVPIAGNYTIDAVAVNAAGVSYVYPTIVVVNGNGSGFVGEVIGVDGGIIAVKITNKGSDYTFLTLSTTGGNGAVLSPVLAPIQGHGYDAEKELGATNILFNTTIILPNAADTGTKYPLSNFYRTIGIISNVEGYGTGTPFGGDVGTNMEYVTGTIQSGSGFQSNEIVQGSTSGGQAKVVEYSAGTGTLKLIRTLEEKFTPFQSGEPLIGATSGTNMTIGSITLPDVEKYTGEIKYVENRTPISRQADQFEEIKIVIEF